MSRLPVVALVLVATLGPGAARSQDSLTELADLLDGRRVPKHALVLGIQDYSELPKVTNARNDAETVAQALRDLGFNVDSAPDLDRTALFSRLDEFVERTLAVSPPENAVVAFYFAGHGFRLGSENFLVPANAPRDPDRLPHGSVALSHVVERILERPVALAVFFVDACRTELQGPLAPAVDLGFIEPQGIETKPVYFGFASGFGRPSKSFVREGDSNSPFAQALARRLQSFGLELHDLFEEVRRDVATATSDDQVPAEHKVFLGEYWFRPSPDHLRDQQEKLALALLKASDQGRLCIDAFLKRYPAGPYSNSARAWLLTHADDLETGECL